jgi:hypothetical protein
MRAPADQVRLLKRRADSIRLTADGVVPLGLTCPSSREALLGPAGAAYTKSGIVVATDGSLRSDGSIGAAMVAKDGHLPARSVAVFGQLSSLRPELTGIALALEGCPGEEDLNILTDSLSSMRLLKSMQRVDFPLSLHRHPARQAAATAGACSQPNQQARGGGTHTALYQGSCAQRRATQ